MKIFVMLSRVPWPLEKGDKLRAYHQIRELSLRHEIYLFCLSDRDVSPEAVQHLKETVHTLEIVRLGRLRIFFRMFRALFSDRPFQVHYFYQAHAAKRLKRAISRFAPDHIYCQLIRCAEYVKHLHEYPRTLDYMDALNAGLRRRAEISPWPLSAFIREEARRVVAYENLIFDYFDRHTIISRQDRQLIYHPDRSSIRVIPNGVDTDYFRPDHRSHKEYDLLFTGNMSYAPNVDCAVRLAREILPLVRREIPSARLLIAGASPAAAVRALRSESVEVTGWLDDIRTAYGNSRLFVAPMRIGSGLQNKLLEAMSMELPCLTTPLAANAMHEDARQVLYCSDENEQLAREIVSLLRNDELRRKRGAASRNTVIAHFNWGATAAQLEQLFFASAQQQSI
jgi:polysaccharide biosynthesis protein PslH